MLESSDVIAFTAATDLGRARAFYEEALGLPLVGQNDIACVFDANGTMLRVTAVPEVSRAGYTVLGWRVSDIAAAARDLAARGVVFIRYDGMDQDDPWRRQGGLVRRPGRQHPLAHAVPLTRAPAAVPAAHGIRPP